LIPVVLSEEALLGCPRPRVRISYYEFLEGLATKLSASLGP